MMKLLIDNENELRMHEEILSNLHQQIMRGDAVVRPFPFCYSPKLTSLSYSLKLFLATKVVLKSEWRNTTRRRPVRSTRSMTSTSISAREYMRVAWLQSCSRADLLSRKCNILTMLCRQSQISFQLVCSSIDTPYMC